MKKIGILVSILLFAAVFCACGAQQSDAPAGEEAGTVVNPVTEVTGEELLAQTGIAFALPEGAENVIYSVINGDSVIGQMTFTLDGVKCTCRAQLAPLPEDGTVPDISGMHFQWEKTVAGQVFYSDARFLYNPGAEGVVNWYDYAPGVLYSVGVDRNAAEVFLKDLAEMTCPPLQEETEGEDTSSGNTAPEGAPEIDGADLEEIAE